MKSFSLSAPLLAEKFVPGGQALASFQSPTLKNGEKNPHFGKKVFLWNALPGEIIQEATITKQKSRYLEGIATKVLSPSPHRVAPKDSCYLSTSPWQILSWNYELQQKRFLVQESLAQEHLVLPKNVSVAPTVTDNTEWHYRNKMEYSLYWDNQDSQIYLAFHARGTHAKIPLKPSNVPSDALDYQTAISSIERPEIAKKAQKIVQELNNAHASARDYQSLLLRVSRQGIVSGGLLKNGQPHPIFPNLSDAILGQTYSYSPNGFFQINLPVYELALKAIKQAIDASSCQNILDLYSGVGTIGLSVASSRHLTLVESNPSAYKELKKNSPSYVNCVLARSEDCLDFIQTNQIVILDPPRAGCDQKLINRLLEVIPEKIIYLSCNPSTQARDVRLLTSSNRFQIQSIAPFNFFPKTPHIENLIILNKVI